MKREGEEDGSELRGQVIKYVLRFCKSVPLCHKLKSDDIGIEVGWNREG